MNADAFEAKKKGLPRKRGGPIIISDVWEQDFELMAQIAKVENGAIKLPVEYSIEASGEQAYHVEPQPDGSLVLRPIDPEQRWFWSRQWQEGEREADVDVKEGRSKQYRTPEEFLDSLE